MVLQSCKIVNYFPSGHRLELNFSEPLITFSIAPINSASPVFSVNMLRSSAKPKTAWVVCILGAGWSTLSNLPSAKK